MMSLESIRQSPEMSAYFDSLPLAVQETIVQSGVQADSLEALKECARVFGAQTPQ